MAVQEAESAAPSASDPETPTDGARHRGGRRAVPLDLVLLLLAPAAAFGILRVRPMTDLGLVDSWIYTGYQLNGPDLIRRFGPDAYHWVRLGATVPERVSSYLFGAVPGFFVLRYALVLLAIVPLFVLVRGVAGRAGAWAAVVAVLASPVAWNTWGTDYPDALIFSYLIGGICLLALPTRGRWARVATVVGGGVALSLAVHSQVVVAPMVAVAVVVHLVVAGRGWRAAIATAGGLLAVLAAVTGGLMLIAHAWLGQWDIFTPTITNYETLQQPAKVVMWHSVSNRWLLYIPSTAVPYLVVGAWLVLAVRDRRRISRPEVALGATAALGAVAWLGLQFVGQVAALEYRLYVSALWAVTLPVLGLVAVRLAGPVGSRRAWWAPGVLLAAGLAVSYLHLPVTLSRARNVLVIAAVVVVVVLAAWVFARVRVAGAVVGVAAATVVVAALAVTTVLPAHKPRDPAQFTPIAQPQYNAVFGAITDRTFLRSYGLAAQLPDVIGPGADGAKPLFWSAKGVPGQTPSDLPATYRWKFTKAGIPTPQTRDGLIGAAYAARPDPLVIVALTDAQAQEYVDVWTAAGHPLTVTKRTAISSFGLTVQIWLARPTDQLEGRA